MRSMHKVQSTMLALALAAMSVVPAHATTLRRMSLEELVKANGSIVVGEVVDVHSYWNEEGTFILTDVRVALSEVIRGTQVGALTITLMGGTVLDVTTLIVGGAELIPGRSYVLFLDPEDLPGARQALTVRDHARLRHEGGSDLAECRPVGRAGTFPPFTA